MSLVLDSSVALSWCFEDERTPATAALLDGVTETGAFAPSLWPIETLNGLLVAERRGRIDRTRRQRLAGFLRMLPVCLDAETVAHVWTSTAPLAERYRLSAYDATYLELALRLNLSLATLDRRLRSAATALEISLLGL